VVGTGRIGLREIQIARGFSMRVLAFDPHEHAVIADLLGFECRPLDELLGAAEIVTLHAPHTPATHHLVGSLARRKQAAVPLRPMFPLARRLDLPTGETSSFCGAGPCSACTGLNVCVAGACTWRRHTRRTQ